MERSWDHFPLFISSKDKAVLVVGGGKIATRRLKALLPFSFTITVVSPLITEEMKAMRDSFHYLERKFQEEDLTGNFLVLACTDDKELNRTIAQLCHEQGIYVSAASSKEDSSFFFPGMYVEDDLLFALSSDGKDYHKTAKVLKAKRKEIHED